MSVNIVIKSNNTVSKDIPLENLSLTQPSIVQLDIAPEKVARFERRDNDLALVLKDGRTVIVQNFFVVDANGVRSDLVLLDDSGVLWWGQYSSPWAQFHFTEIEWIDAPIALLPNAGAIPGWLLAGLGALGLIVASDINAGGSSQPESNRAPTALADPLSLKENGTGSGKITAQDPDGDVPRFTVTTPPANGTVTVNPDGTFVYTPNPGFSG